MAGNFTSHFCLRVKNWALLHQGFAKRPSYYNGGYTKLYESQIKILKKKWVPLKSD